MSEAPATTSTHDAASNGEQHAVPKATFELPRESAKTVLKKEERTYVIDLVTGKTALEPVAKDTQTEKLVLLCIEPDTQHGQTEAAVRAAKRVVQPGDCLIFMTVLPLNITPHMSIGAFGGPYDANHQLESLLMMRKDTIDALRKLFKEFPSGVHGYARVVHGAVEKEILLAAEETLDYTWEAKNQSVAEARRTVGLRLDSFQGTLYCPDCKMRKIAEVPPDTWYNVACVQRTLVDAAVKVYLLPMMKLE